MDVAEDELQQLYTWVDEIPLSRPKRNISRDFSDGVLVAEVVAHYFPRLVEIHNYSAVHGVAQKIYNWNTLNNKVFRKLNFTITREEIEAAASAAPGMIERILKLLKYKIAKYANGPALRQPNSPDAQWNSQNRAPFKGENGSSNHIGSVPYGGTATGRGLSSGRSRPGTDDHHQATADDKEATIHELEETVEILETKVKKLEQLVRLKESKIQALATKLQQAGVS